MPKEEKGSLLRQYLREQSLKRAQKRAKELSKIKAKDLLTLLPIELQASIGEAVGVDYQVKRLFGPLLVQLFILAILRQEDTSLQSLTDLYNSPTFSFFSGKGGHKTARNSLSDRLSTIKCAYFEQLYEAYLEQLRLKYGKALGKTHNYLCRFDSTMVALSAAMTQIGMRVGAIPKKGKGKVQIKISLGLKGILPTTVKVFHEQAQLSEEVALKTTIESQMVDKDGIITFDMGLKSRKTLQSFDKDGRFFVTRVQNPRFEYCSTHKHIQGRKHGQLCFESDQIVKLYQSGGDKNILDHEFRLITATCERGKNATTTFYFLTNILDLTAFQIADIYLKRWDIEVFFRFLKQQVGLKNLLSTNENGIKTVVYLRLLVGSMIWVFAYLNKRKDYKALKREFAYQVEFEIQIAIARLIGDKNPEKIKLYSLDFQGIIPKKSP